MQSIAPHQKELVTGEEAVKAAAQLGVKNNVTKPDRSVKKEDVVKLRVFYGGHEVRKGMRIENKKDGGIYKVTSVRPNGKISLVCKKCGYRMEVRPVSVEYLQALIDRPQPSGAMYV